MELKVSRENYETLIEGDARIVGAIESEARTLYQTWAVGGYAGDILDKIERNARCWIESCKPSADLIVYRGGNHVAVTWNRGARVLLIAVQKDELPKQAPRFSVGRIHRYIDSAGNLRECE